MVGRHDPPEDADADAGAGAGAGGGVGATGAVVFGATGGGVFFGLGMTVGLLANVC